MPSRAVGHDNHETLPLIAVAFSFGAQAAQETFLELEDFLDFHAHDHGFGGGDGAIDHEDVFELVLAGRQDAGALVDFMGIEQVEHGKALHLQDFVHALETQATLAVQEVGDVGLFEARLLCQA